MDAASGKGDWTFALQLFQQTISAVNGEAYTLQNVGKLNAGRDHQLFAAYYESNDYAANFVSASLESKAPFLSLTTKMRSELTMKGVVLQSVTMGVVNSLHSAVDACLEPPAAASKNLDSPSFVDLAWAMFSAKKAQIALGEKRCPQFDTCKAVGPPQDSKSIVNFHLLGYFQAALTHSRGGKCWLLQQQVDLIVSSLTIPVIQGMLREAYEVDPRADGVADGLVEVCEGWGFAAAVLPRIARCNATAGDIINANMNTVPFIASTAAGVKGVYMKDGFQAVVDAVESTFECLGIQCSDVKSMVSPDTGHPLWQSCQHKIVGDDADGTISRKSYEVWRQVGIAFIVISIVMTTLLCFSIFCSSGESRVGGRRRGASELCAAPRAEPENPELHGSLVDNKGGPTEGGVTSMEVDMARV